VPPHEPNRRHTRRASLRHAPAPDSMVTRKWELSQNLRKTHGYEPLFVAFTLGRKIRRKNRPPPSFLSTP
jgi:hypothetical protein